MKHILMIAAENDGIHHAKVGGIADVIRDVPPYLSAKGFKVSVLLPSYGYLHKTEGAKIIDTAHYFFAGKSDSATLYAVPAKETHKNVYHYVIDNPHFLSYNQEHNEYYIYVNDTHEPFYSDALKFARFAMATAEMIKKGLLGRVSILHLHDWHAAFLLILREFHPLYLNLKKIPTVYSIHNLTLQGVRPLENNSSSLAAWYPELRYDRKVVADPYYHDCINPMAVGIRLADKVHTVSPSYAEEILLPSEHPHFYGGEGLEKDLMEIKKKDKLVGILNGCNYPEKFQLQKLDFFRLIDFLKSELLQWMSRQDKISTVDFIAFENLTQLGKKGGGAQIILTSITRVVEQKLLILKSPAKNGKSGLENILNIIGPGGVYFFIGSGDKEYENFLKQISAKCQNFVFLNGYLESCAKALYASGDLFVMPSSYEPCGLSQMQAMLHHQPCLVNYTGGLKDTVKNYFNGFCFGGKTLEQQVESLTYKLFEAVQLKTRQTRKWHTMQYNAACTRFNWQDSVLQYIEKLYNPLKK